MEVKTRSGRGYGTPGESVHARKRARLARVAAVWLARCGEPLPPCRFDVVEVVATGAEPLRTHHVRDAFRLWRAG